MNKYLTVLIIALPLAAQNPGGGGAVNAGASGQVAYYAASGSTVSGTTPGMPAVNYDQVTGWGDSLTYGGQSGDFISWPNQLSGLSGRVINNEGISGQTSTQIAARMTAGGSLNNGIVVVEAGENNFSNASQVETDIASMVAAVPSGANYVVLSIPNGANNPSGSGNYTAIMAINSFLASTYGSHYLDWRSQLVASYNASNPVDVLDHANDVWPFSLRAQSQAFSSAAVTSSGCAFTFGSTAFPYTVAIVDSEYIQITAGSDGAYTCTRGYGSTTAASHSAGVVAYLVDPLHLGHNQSSTMNGYVVAAQKIWVWMQANPPTSNLMKMLDVNTLFGNYAISGQYMAANPLVIQGGSGTTQGSMIFQYGGNNRYQWNVNPDGTLNLADNPNFKNAFQLNSSTGSVIIGESGNGFVIDGLGKVGIGAAPTAGAGLSISSTLAGATSGDSFGFLSQPTINWNTSSGGSVWGMGGAPAIAASSGTIGTAAAVLANGLGMSKSGGVAITNAYGVYALQPTIGATNFAGYFSGNTTVTGTETVNNGITTFGFITANALVSNGFKFTTTGCSVSATTGGSTAGTFTLGANSCTVVIQMNSAAHPITAPTGWSCSAHDRTAPTVLIGGESSSTTTTASVTIPAGAGTTDVISFSCTAF